MDSGQQVDHMISCVPLEQTPVDWKFSGLDIHPCPESEDLCQLMKASMH